jgi:hypothetical protein
VEDPDPHALVLFEGSGVEHDDARRRLLPTAEVHFVVDLVIAPPGRPELPSSEHA